MKTNASQNYFSNLAACSLHIGCDINIKMKDNCSKCNFTFDLENHNFRNGILFYEVKDNVIEAKVDFN